MVFLKINSTGTFNISTKTQSGCWNRRLSLTVLILLFNSLAFAQQQNNLDVITKKWLQYSDAPNALYHYLTDRAYELLQNRSEKLIRLHTADEWKKYQVGIKQTVWRLLGPFQEKTKLNVRTTSIIQKKDYRIENIIYESLPGFYVTASLFIPDRVKSPAPAILFCTGHSGNAYRRELYQLPLLNLVKKGFIVLAFDPIAQGERLQYFDAEKGESVIGGSTLEHSYPSVQVSLLGKSIARYFVWDGIRGIDYLVSRKEVDPARIGVHGLSGGGTQTAYISALDDRVVASAPAGYITSFRRLLESIGVQDGEQNLYQELANGIDHADFIIARAPKPTLIMATTEDFFSIQGVRESFSDLKKVFAILDKPGDLQKTEDSGGHGYTQKNREAMYAFFQKYLELPGSSAEEEVDFATSQELQKTPTGQLATSLGGETVFSLNKKEAEKCLQQLEDTRSASPDHLSGMLDAAKKLSGYQEPGSTPQPVFTGQIKRAGYTIEKYFEKGEDNYVFPFLLMIPEVPNGKAMIYLHPEGKVAEAGEEGEIERYIREGYTVLAPDLIGTGEMGPGIFKGDSFISFTSYNLWFTALITDKTIVGTRASDIIQLVHFLKGRKDIKAVYGIARKEMAPVMLYAAAFDKRIEKIVLLDGYSSYRSIVTSRYYFPGFVQNLVPGALSAYDLPDLAASLAPRRLIIAGILDSNGKRTDEAAVEQDMKVIRKTYKQKGADGQLIVLQGDRENIIPLLSR